METKRFILRSRLLTQEFLNAGSWAVSFNNKSEHFEFLICSQRDGWREEICSSTLSSCSVWCWWRMVMSVAMQWIVPKSLFVFEIARIRASWWWRVRFVWSGLWCVLRVWWVGGHFVFFDAWFQPVYMEGHAAAMCGGWDWYWMLEGFGWWWVEVWCEVEYCFCDW